MTALKEEFQYALVLLPGLLAGAAVFLPLGIIAGRWIALRPTHWALRLLAFMSVQGVLWCAVAFGGFAYSHEYFGFRDHGAIYAFLVPYLLVTLPSALILLLWFSAKLRSHPHQAS